MPVLALLCVALAVGCLNLVGVAILVTIRVREIGVRKVLKPSDELSDFLADIRRSGYGCVRIDPDTLMRRGPQR